MNAVRSRRPRTGATRTASRASIGAATDPASVPLLVGMQGSMSGHRVQRVTTRLDLEYDGTDFAGWARQPGKRTVQDELERALCTLLREDAVPLTVAGRTDAGVHAWGQV